MKRWLVTGCALMLGAAGCTPQPQAGDNGSLANPNTSTRDLRNNPKAPAPPLTDASRVMATINGRPITMEQLGRPVFEAYGLQFLLHLVQLELAKSRAAELKLAVTPEDITRERQLTLEQLFASSVNAERLKLAPEEEAEFRRKEYERLLPQFLGMQRISMPEFDLAMESGAYLRKVAAEQVKDKITEEALQDAFRIEYGEKVRVRHIQLANMQEVADALRRLQAGEPFEKVAQSMSRNKETGPQGGAIRPFSRVERYWPQAFSAAAFDLKNPGDISEVVQTGDAYHLIKLEERIAPRAVRYEDHKEILREKLYNLLVQVRIKQIRDEIALESRTAMKIEDPMLRQQYVQRLERAAGATGADADQVRREMELDRRSGAAATQPSTQPAQPITDPGHGVARPPATMPGK